MTTRWVLAKYMGDMRRREPVNIGVIVIGEEGSAARFIGEKPDGNIDGRRARPMRSPIVYRQWVYHWRGLLASDRTDDLCMMALHPRHDENYFLEAGGEILLGGNVSPRDLLDDLYTSLVDETPDPMRESIGELAERVIADLTQTLPKPIDREAVVRVHHPDNKVDELYFDYRYNNGVPHLMQRVSLSFNDARSWDRVHAAAWSFSEVRRDPNLQDAQFIALYKPREPDAMLDQQLGQLERLGAHTVDVSEPDTAIETLAGLLED